MNPIEEFKEKIENLYEVDRGDFRRRASLYLDRLIEVLPDKAPALLQIKNSVLYQPYCDNEELRRWILDHTQ